MDVSYLLALIPTLVIAGSAGAHVIMYKRDSRSAAGWLAFIISLPILGALIYWMLGVNRIYRRAAAAYRDHEPMPAAETEGEVGPEAVRCFDLPQLDTLARFGERITGAPLSSGNRIRPFSSVAEAMDAMIAAVGTAERSITLSTYIFDHDDAGFRFMQALEEAVERGVEVRVLIDAVGDRYTRPPMHGLLDGAGVPCAIFMPTWIPAYVTYANLRNHRKLLVVDGRKGFTGGMNIRAADRKEYPLQDLHFEVEGPVIGKLQRVFADDWAFTVGERLEGPLWFPPLEEDGPVIARVVEDGPAESFGHLRWILLGALASAQKKVRIVTPYFLPDEGLITAVNMAVHRGVDVEILIPAHSNLLVVQWATRALLWQVLESGCKILLTPRPFDHSKVMVVDSAWSFIGSANWDARSLRLNFELNVEAYCPRLAAELERLIAEKRSRATPITLEEVDARPKLVRLRDGTARLLTPYL